MQSVKTRFITNFELVRWVTYLFLGGAVNASIIQIYGDFLLRIPQIFAGPFTSDLQRFLFLGIPLLGIGLAPLVLSIVLTLAKPEKQIVPPLYISLVSFAWFTGFLAIRYPSDFYPVVFLYGFLAYFVGAVENRVASYLLGISAYPSDFVSYSLVVGARMDKVKGILETEGIKGALGIFNTKEIADEHKLKLAGKNGYRLTMQASESADSVNLAIVFYDLSDWYLRPVSGGLGEYAKLKVAYLRSVFMRPEHQLTISDGQWGETADTKSLVSTTVKRMEGVLPHYQEISRLGWVKVVAFIIALGIIGYTALWLQDLPTSAGLFVALLLYLAFEVRSSTAGERKGETLSLMI